MLDPRVKTFIKGKDVFVDFGCGKGDILDELVGSYGTLIGLDKYDKRLKKRSTTYREWIFIQADLNHQFPLSSDSVDTALANQVIEHILDPRFFATEIYRILRRGGVGIITTPNIRYVKNLMRIVINGRGPRTAGDNKIDGPWDDGHIHYFTHRDLREIFFKSGFSDVWSTGFINLGNGGLARRIVCRYSAVKPFREFFSGNILLVARK